MPVRRLVRLSARLPEPACEGKGQSMEIRPADQGSIEDLRDLFCTDRAAAGCWCMWFIVPVREYHAAGGAGNRARLRELAALSELPVGLIAYQDGAPVGWCAVGPRSRYVRAIRTPTYEGRDPQEDDAVWLLPCLFVRKEARRSGLSEQLVKAAVRLAQKHGAVALEAFPHAGQARRSKDTQVGFEAVFSRCGFAVIRRPAASRVVMRLQFQG
jgi:GNAT superfamily N-acetyltransferase